MPSDSTHPCAACANAMASPASPLHRDRWTSALALGIRTCLVLLVSVSLAACRHRDEQSLTTNDAPWRAVEIPPSTATRTGPDAYGPRTRARSHVLLGIDFSRSLKLPECARYHTSFDRPDRTCVYLGGIDHKPFKIEFSDGSVPDFLKWNNAMVSTDARGRPQMLRFDIGNEPALQGKAVDAMLETFGPPTSVENSGSNKVGTWQHRDYVIQYVFNPDGGGSVQMETKAFHEASTASAVDGGARNAEL